MKVGGDIAAEMQVMPPRKEILCKVDALIN